MRVRCRVGPCSLDPRAVVRPEGLRSPWAGRAHAPWFPTGRRVRDAPECRHSVGPGGERVSESPEGTNGQCVRNNPHEWSGSDEVTRVFMIAWKGEGSQVHHHRTPCGPGAPRAPRRLLSRRVLTSPRGPGVPGLPEPPPRVASSLSGSTAIPRRVPAPAEGVCTALRRRVRSRTPGRGRQPQRCESRFRDPRRRGTTAEMSMGKP